MHLFSAAGVGGLQLVADGVTVIDGETDVPDDPVEAMTRPGELRAALWLEAGSTTRLRLEFRPAADGAGPLAVRLGIVPAADDDDLLAEAVAAASSADVAIVVVGSAELTESEGFDRSTLALPGRQDELITKVTAVNSNTIVVVNSGMPVLHAMGRAGGSHPVCLAARTGLRRCAGRRPARTLGAGRQAAGDACRPPRPTVRYCTRSPMPTAPSATPRGC